MAEACATTYNGNSHDEFDRCRADLHQFRISGTDTTFADDDTATEQTGPRIDYGGFRRWRYYPHQIHDGRWGRCRLPNVEMDQCPGRNGDVRAYFARPGLVCFPKHQ